MIIRLCEDTPKLALKIVQHGCDGKQLMDLGVSLFISKRPCYKKPPPPPKLDACLQPIDEPAHPPPIVGVEYPAFELDDQGRIVFYFDDKLWSMSPGRYQGHVEIGGHCDQTTFDIDLCTRGTFIEQIVQQEAVSCGGDIC